MVHQKVKFATEIQTEEAYSSLDKGLVRNYLDMSAVNSCVRLRFPRVLHGLGNMLWTWVSRDKSIAVQTRN